MARSANGNRFRAFAKVALQCWVRGICLNPFVKTGKTLESVGVDGGARSHIVLDEGTESDALLKSGMTAIRTRPEAFPRFSTRRRRGPLPAFQLPASPQTGLRSANPRIVHLHFAAQRLAFQVHHRPAKLMKHHPCRLVTSQTELTLQKKRRDAALYRWFIKVCRPEPNRQRELRLVKDRPCRQRYLTPTAAHCQRPSPANSRCTPVAHCDTQNRPANGRQPGTPGTQLRWQTVTGTRSGSSEMLGVPRPTLPLRLLKQPDKQKQAR